MLDIVVNTGPILALVASTGSLEWLLGLYGRVVIPYEVFREIEAGGPDNPELLSLRAIEEQILMGQHETAIDAALLRELDLGEASVISSASFYGINTVAIDEKAGRRMARIHGLKVTGSLGILLKAKRHGLIPSLAECVTRMRARDIWISADLVEEVLRQADEG